MPASTLNPVNAAIRSSLSNTGLHTNLDIQLAGATKKALLADIEFESAGSYQNSVLDKLKTKYIVLKSTDTLQQTSSNSEKMGADETLSLTKHELYPLEAVQLGWSNTEWVVGAGMVNMGNTCYLNSTLQALFHVPALVNWLVSDKQHMSQCEDSGGLCIICAMRKTLQDSQQRNANSIRPFLIYNKLRVVCRNLIPGRQEDAHEFLRYLVEAMEKAYLSRFKNHSEFDSRTKETTPLNQILGGYLRSAVRCLECGHVSTTFQHFQDLLLDIRKAQTVEEALDGYFSREKLDDEAYHCESCQKKVPATKQFSLERAPMVLCIQLKRFSVSNNKITKHVQFRQRLELTKYARHRPSVPLIYRFVALVTHMGPTVGCGHYTAVAQAPCGNYYQFDDSMVRPISHQAVFNTNAYIMLYELECPPFSPLKAQNNGAAAVSAKTKSATSVNSNSCISSSSGSGSIAGSSGTCGASQKENNNSHESKSSFSSKLQLNGSRVPYGPELPPKLEMLMLTTMSATAATKSGIVTSKSTVLGERNGVVSSSGGDSTSNGGGAGGRCVTNNNVRVGKLNGNSLDAGACSPSSHSSSSDSDSEQTPKQQIVSSAKENGAGRSNIAPLTVSTTSNTQSCQAAAAPHRSSRGMTPVCRPSSKLVNNNAEVVVANPMSSLKFGAGSDASCASAVKSGVAGDHLKSAEIISRVASTAAFKRKGDCDGQRRGTTAAQTVTKLVPYDVDDDDDDGDDEEEDDDADDEIDEDEGNTSSTSSGGPLSTSLESETTADRNPSRNGNPPAVSGASNATATTTTSVPAASVVSPPEDRVSTKATIGDWKVTPALDRNAHGPSNEGRSWDKKTKPAAPCHKEEKTVNTIGELLKMSHGGYAAPVNSWNGSRAGLDMEFAEERREDRKRSLCDHSDRGRIKHIKTTNSSGSYNSNPGYNRIQEFHNAKNSWNQNNTGGSSYSATTSNGNRQFYNTGGKHRNRRNNFHHKNNYHKNNYAFRQ